MGKLTLVMNVSLDGCCDHTQVIADDELHEHATQVLRRASGALFGRVTYELMRDAWPSVARTGSGPPAMVAFARELDGKPKFVVSRDTTITGWNTSVVPPGDLGDQIRALKERIGGDLIMGGSARLAGSLARMNLIDEYRLLVQPIVAGRGPRLFEGLEEPIRLELFDSKVFASGVTLLRYRRRV
ncbi:MAG TPA: dihydrofolate reductase family protein [Thermoanaerobaculia bacterium]|jgi:dihydrofolate reductase|nr:dihydrofolate reductase family protein [Thermoanaerobaculia bacterium]